jgi:hypothetical protein
MRSHGHSQHLFSIGKRCVTDTNRSSLAIFCGSVSDTVPDVPSFYMRPSSGSGLMCFE